MKDYKVARWALDKHRLWLETDFAHYFEPDPRTFPDYEGSYLRMAAELADAEGRTMDALAAYQTLIVNPWQMQEYGVDRWVARSKELWKLAGGTEEGWRIWAKPRDTGGLDQLPRGVSLMPWRAVNRPLPELHLRDIADRTWTLEDLCGKRVYVLIWASWCGPCWRYLGGVQKVFDATKNSPDSLLLTLSIDDEPAKAAQFMKEHNYNFPVLMAKDWVARFAGLESIGMSWVLDREARVRLTRSQPPLPEDAWVGEALDKLRSR
jgi:peroxiredoxin